MLPTHNRFTLHLSGFPKGTNELKLRGHFSEIDPSIRILDIEIREQKTHTLALLYFISREDVMKAMKKVNYTLMNGCELQLTQYHPAEIRNRTRESIFIKNLPHNMRSKELYALASEFGEIMSCKVNYNSAGICKGSGQVEFKSKESADKALMKWNGEIICGNKISVSPFAVCRLKQTDMQGTLFIKGIPKYYTNEDLKKLLSNNTNIKIATVAKNNKDDKDNKGFGYITFNDNESMMEAKKELEGKVIEGNELYVEKAVPKEEQKELRRERRYQKHKDCNLYVGSLPEHYNDEMLKKIFEQFGKVISARVMLEPKQDWSTGKVESKSKGYGFVCFSNPEEAQNALRAFDEGHTVEGSNLIVSMAEKKEERKIKHNIRTPTCMPSMPYAPMVFYIVTIETYL